MTVSLFKLIWFDDISAMISVVLFVKFRRSLWEMCLLAALGQSLFGLVCH